MVKRRISKARRLGTSAIPTIIETESGDQKDEEASENITNLKQISKLGNKLRRQSTGSSKGNTRKVQNLIQGQKRVNMHCKNKTDLMMLPQG